jgi:hypothetical protein
MQAIRRVTVPLTEDECNALRTMANAELRDPREQARYLLRAALGLSGNDVQPRPNANRVAKDFDPQRDAVAV